MLRGRRNQISRGFWKKLAMAMAGLDRPVPLRKLPEAPRMALGQHSAQLTKAVGPRAI